MNSKKYLSNFQKWTAEEKQAELSWLKQVETCIKLRYWVCQGWKEGFSLSAYSRDVLLASWSRQMLWSLFIEPKCTLALTYGPQLSQPNQLGQVGSDGGDRLAPCWHESKLTAEGLLSTCGDQPAVFRNAQISPEESSLNNPTSVYRSCYNFWFSFFCGGEVGGGSLVWFPF